MNAFNEAEVFAMFDEVIKAISPLPLDKVVFNVMYAKSASVLDFDQVERINQRYTGSYYTSYGNVTHRVDSYKTYTTRQDVTVIKDKDVSIDYSFIVGKSVGRSVGGAKFSDLLGKIEIITNDTPNSKYEKIENPTSGR